MVRGKAFSLNKHFEPFFLYDKFTIRNDLHITYLYEILL